MTQISWPWGSGAGRDPSEDRFYEMAQYWLGPGVIRSAAADFANPTTDLSDNLQVFGDSTGLQVKVKRGRAWIGHYFKSDVQVTLAITSNASGNPRRDLVVLRMDRTLTDNQMVLMVIPGTPAGSPVTPSPVRTASVYDLPLAEVAVANGAVTISAGNVDIDRRTYAQPGGMQVSYVVADTAGTILGSRNVSSIVDAGAGLLTVVWDNDYATANYAVTPAAQNDGAMEATVSNASPPTVGSASVRVFNTAFAVTDPVKFHVTAIGVPSTS